MGRKYSEEFKRDAIRQSDREGVRSASEKLGIPEKALYGWRRKARLERGEGLPGLRAGETPEEGLRRLARENDELREANHILKKAMGFMVGR